MEKNFKPVKRVEKR